MPAYLNGGATRLQILVVCIVAVIAIALAVYAINYQRGLSEAHQNASRSAPVSDFDTPAPSSRATQSTSGPSQ